MFDLSGILSSGEKMLEAGGQSMAHQLITGAITRVCGDTVQVTDFQHDAQAGKFSVTLALKGETDPLKLDVNDYKIEHVDTASYLVINQATASKPWVQSIINFIIPRKLPIPSESQAAIKAAQGLGLI